MGTNHPEQLLVDFSKKTREEKGPRPGGYTHTPYVRRRTHNAFFCSTTRHSSSELREVEAVDEICIKYASFSYQLTA